MLSGNELSQIIQFTKKIDGREIWHFGSSNDPTILNPNDIDIAIMLRKKKDIATINQLLLNHFPKAVFDFIDSYNTRNAQKYHFIFFSSDDLAKPLAKSIKNGKCLWKNN